MQCFRLLAISLVLTSTMGVARAALQSEPVQGEPGGRPSYLTPPPDQFDAEQDLALAALWGGPEHMIGPVDPNLPEQPAPLRPEAWTVFSQTQVDPAKLVAEITSPSQGVDKAGGREVAMPESGELKGDFDAARTRLHVEQAEVRFVRAPGVTTVFVNGEGFIGDPERRGWLGVPVELNEGWNTIWAAGIRGGFDLDFWKPMTRMVVATWALDNSEFTHPRVLDNATGYSVPFFNASSRAAENVHCHYAYTCDPLKEIRRPHEWSDGGFLEALDLFRANGFLFDFGVLLDDEQWKRSVFSVSVFDSSDTLAHRIVASAHDFVGLESQTASQADDWLTERSDSFGRKYTPPVIVHEPGPDASATKLSHSVARFCQQSYWYARRLVVPIVSRERFDSEGFASRTAAPHVIRIGYSDTLESGTLIMKGARSSRFGPGATKILASDVEAMKLAYTVSPLVATLEQNSAEWQVR